MAIQVPKLFDPVQLAAAAATIFTMAANPATLILSRCRMRFTNTDTVARAVTAYGIPNGGAAGAGNAFLNAESIAPNQHLDVDVPVLGPGGFVQGFADVANKVTAHQLDGVLFS